MLERDDVILEALAAAGDFREMPTGIPGPAPAGGAWRDPLGFDGKVLNVGAYSVPLCARLGEVFTMRRTGKGQRAVGH